MRKCLILLLFLASDVAADDLYIRGPDGSLKYKVTENPYSGACCEVYDKLGRWIGSVGREPYSWSGDHAFSEGADLFQPWQDQLESGFDDEGE